MVPFLFFNLSLISIWFSKSLKVWGTLLALALASGWAFSLIKPSAFLFIFSLLILWIFYTRASSFQKKLLFVVLILFSLGFKFHLFPGFSTWKMTDRFQIGFSTPIIGVFPLGFIVPLSKTLQEWKRVLLGALTGCGFVMILALLAVFSNTVTFDVSLPSFFLLRSVSNLFLSCIPEEAFFRGFIQRTLASYFANSLGGKVFALITTSLLFTASHIFWSPSLSILLFVFFAGLLYGGIYLIFEKIEAAILTHLFLNLAHMIFFTYHAA